MQALGLALLLLLSLPTAPLAADSHANFETVPVRPLALSPDGGTLFAVNTPDARLEIFDVVPNGLVRRGWVPVGLEPVAVAARTNDEVWVVNHLSDSVSVVDVASTPPRVVRTLLVGDEPWDVAFAGPREEPGDPFPRAFVTAARRGQNHPENPNDDLTTPGLGRADIWVFDADALGPTLGGTPEAIVTVFGDKPRPLAVSPDGSRVYAGIFHSGSRTTVINQGGVCNGGGDRGPCVFGQQGADDPPVAGEPGTGSPPVLPGGVPAPNVDAIGTPMPESGLIVKFDEPSGEWRDAIGRNWNGAVPISLPDLDVFEIDALADPPVETAAFPGVGTILFDIAVHPNGALYVANTDARNEIRFEGPGDGTTTVRGRLHEARITRIGGAVEPRHLNKHIDYAAVPMTPGTAQKSLATPHGLALSADGGQLYVAALGSNKVGVFSTAALDDDSFVPNAADHIELTVAGPAGLVLDEANDRLYVYARFDNAVASVDLSSGDQVQTVLLHNPEPEVVRAGRRFLYDARLTSSNGEASCSSCHIHADKDDLAWNLGNPAGVTVPNPNPVVTGPKTTFHPLKGPMTTQTLRGMDDHGPMHWRGDRTGATVFPSFDPFDEILAFEAFNPAFVSLVGRDEGQLPDADMRAFAEFALTILPPPNPVQPLDNVDTPDVAEGRRTYFEDQVNITGTCNNCHRLDPAQGFFGASGLSVFDPGDFKIPHMRNMYDKVGLDGLVAFNPMGNAAFPRGDQIRGFGFTNDGSIGDLSTFLFLAGFEFANGPAQRDQVVDFLLAFPSNFAPVVGQQVTLTPSSGADVHDRVSLLHGGALTPFVLKDSPGARECDLVVKGNVAGEARGWVLDPSSGMFEGDRAADPALNDVQLRSLASVGGHELTYTCVPPGSGVRLGIDRDEDGLRDHDELDGISDPENAGSVPGACNDGIDNDGDGLTDHPDDPGCILGFHHLENPECDDGVDNDGDGLADWDGAGGAGSDPACTHPWRDLERDVGTGCGLAGELALLFPALIWISRRHDRRSRRDRGRV